MVEELIPIVMFISIAAVMIFLFWFRYKARNDMQATFRQALDKGQELTPEVIDRLGHPKPAKDKDFRLSVIWLSLAVALVLIGVAVPDAEALRGLMAGAALPFCIGVAYMILHLFSKRED